MKRQDELRRIADILDDYFVMENKNQKQIEYLSQQVNNQDKILCKNEEKIKDLESRINMLGYRLDHMLEKTTTSQKDIEKMEEKIDKLPEFKEYWAKLNACGYQD